MGSSRSGVKSGLLARAATRPGAVVPNLARAASKVTEASATRPRSRRFRRARPIAGAKYKRAPVDRVCGKDHGTMSWTVMVDRSRSD